MSTEAWDIDRFPIEKKAISELGMPETDAEWRTWEQAQKAINENRRSDSGFDYGHSEYDPSVWMMGPQAHRHEKFLDDGHELDDEGYEEHGGAHEGVGGYYMPGINAPLDDDDEDREPVDYHVMTGHVDSHDPADWTEHHYTMFEHPDSDYDPNAAWDYFEQDHPQFRNGNSDHEVKNVHPADNHESWHNNLTSENQDFDRVSQHGFDRESPIPGQRTYTMTDPHGGTHRLWHNYTTFHDNGVEHGPGWRTSYYNPDQPQEKQIPWTYHDDASSGDSLGSALDRVQRNLRHADVIHSGTGLLPVENSYGNHYVSRRPGGSTQQLLKNFGYSDEPNWGVVHYPAGGGQYTHTEHGADFQGALAQAKANLARG